MARECAYHYDIALALFVPIGMKVSMISVLKNYRTSEDICM